ncbi:hypothetical protein VAEU17_4400291 [Vibrio aestuarianus]|nr:hypothetical protein VAEKB19_5180003 [Vibrio aestuarianus]CAH8237651.1 hypothetical protein VAEU17_4400291 [Vibrio aestuarianus]
MGFDGGVSFLFNFMKNKGLYFMVFAREYSNLPDMKVSI